MGIKYFFIKLTDNKSSKAAAGKYEERFFDLIYRYMYLFGIAPNETHIGYVMYRTVVWFMIILIIFGEFFYLFHESLNMDVIIDNFSVTAIHLICVFRYGSMLYNMKSFMMLTRAMESKSFDVTTPRRQRMLNSWVRENRKYFIVFLTSGSCTLATWYIYPLVDSIPYNFPASVRLPYDHRSPDRYPYTYACVLLAFHYISYFVIGTDLIIQAILVHTASQFNILSECFRSILKDSQKHAKAIARERSIMDHSRAGDDRFEEIWGNVYTEELRRYIRQHQLLLENAAKLKALLSTPMLAQLLASGLLICFSGYEITASVSANKAKFLMMVQYLLYTLLQLLSLCGWSNEIEVHSYSISEAIYFSGWERGEGGVRGSWPLLRLVMLRARMPLVMTAGGVYDMSLSSYTTLVKTSYSALTVLLRLRKQ